MNLTKKVFLFGLLGIVSFSSCTSSELEKRPLKHHKDNKVFRGDGYFKNDQIQLAICFNKERDTILIDSFENNMLNGMSKEFYSSGSIKKKGRYHDDSRYGIWKEFYETGELKSYEYWGTVDSPMYYSRKYHKSGILDRMKLPLLVSTNNEDSLFQVGKEYLLNVELLHSEFDSVCVYGIFDENPNFEIEKDTVGFYGNIIATRFTPKLDGIDSITGSLFEINGNADKKTVNSEDKMAEQRFVFSYEAKYR